MALSVTERKSDGIINSVMNLLSRPGTYLESIELPGIRFALIRAMSVKGKIDWESIEKICGAYRDRVLLPESINVPENIKIAAPATPAFNARILTRTACKIIELSRMPMYRRVLGIIDPQGAFSDNLPELLAHYTSVRVVTDNTEKYTAVAERMMEEFGAPVMVGSGIDCLSECILIISPDGPANIKASCPVIAGGFSRTGGPNVADSLRITPGNRIISACPDGIDPHFFAGAIYEFRESGFFTRSGVLHNENLPSGMSVEDFGDFVAEKMFFDNKEIPLSCVLNKFALDTGKGFDYNTVIV